jgi:hypothetical protein
MYLEKKYFPPELPHVINWQFLKWLYRSSAEGGEIVSKEVVVAYFESIVMRFSGCTEGIHVKSLRINSVRAMNLNWNIPHSKWRPHYSCLVYV